MKKTILEYGKALLTAFLLAFFIRSFIIEPYKIPSGSMIPTLLIGDHIFVNKFSYGLRIPGTFKWIAEFDDPQRGDVVVFIYPVDPDLDFIKRVVGLPGDKVRMDHQGNLYVNEQFIEQVNLKVKKVNSEDKRKLELTSSSEEILPDHLSPIPYFLGYRGYEIKKENLDGVVHLMQYDRRKNVKESFEITVPENHFFVMGDNRDHSADSREWGFVPRSHLKGKAIFIWLSLDNDLGGIRYKRFGKGIY